jgi:hypothetical protein
VDILGTSAIERAPTRQPEDRLICQATGMSGHLVAILYRGGWRVIEPSIHGFSATGVELLAALQHDGTSDSGHSTGRKTFIVSLIEKVEVLEVAVLAAWRPTLVSPPQGFATIHCSA